MLVISSLTFTLKYSNEYITHQQSGSNNSQMRKSWMTAEEITTFGKGLKTPKKMILVT